MTPDLTQLTLAEQVAELEAERDGLRRQVFALRDTLGPMAYGLPRPTSSEMHTAARSVLESFPRPEAP